MSGTCHCNTCKKATGGAFEAFAIIDKKNFLLVAGADSLVEYRISPKAKKTFCGNCGSPLYNQHRLAPGKLIVHIGTLDDPTCVVPTLNLYCQNMLPWVPDVQSLRNYEQGLIG